MKDKKRTVKESSEFDLDVKYFKYYWLIIPFLTIIYFIFSFFSDGFYQDDEVAHYINMRDFWSEPWIIMSNWGKPGWKILFVIPSLLGYKSIQFLNSLVTAIAAYSVILLSRQLKLRNALIAGILFGLQPLVLQLSFRSYAEIFTGLLLTLSLMCFFKNKFYISSLLCGWAFTVRQESALLCLILAIYMVINKKYLPILFMALFPLLLNLFGFIHSGDPLWAISEMKSLSDFNLGIERGFLHYFEVYIYIIGPVSFTLMIIGILYALYQKNNREFLSRELILYLFFFTVFLFQCYLVIKGTNPGSWRYLLQVSPLAAVIGLIGFNELLCIKNKKYVLYSLIATIMLTLLFFSKEATGLYITQTVEYSKLIVIILLTVTAVFLILWSKKIKYVEVLIIVFILTTGYTFLTEKPKQKGPQNITVNQVADWYNQNLKNSKQVLYNHNLILFYGNIFGNERQKFKILNMKNLNDAPQGTVVIWDSHYSYRPEYKNDTQLDFLQKNPNYKFLNQFYSSDKRFAAFIFEKL